MVIPEQEDHIKHKVIRGRTILQFLTGVLISKAMATNHVLCISILQRVNFLPNNLEPNHGYTKASITIQRRQKGQWGQPLPIVEAPYSGFRH